MTVSSVLQQADTRLLAAARVSRYLLYHLTRTTAAELVPVDSFYIGFRQGESAIVYPYNWDGHEIDDPNVNTFSPEGLTAWIVKHKKTYWSQTDRALLLHRGRAFGDTSRRSAEAIVTPLLENRRVIGVLALLSYTEGVYDPTTCQFLEGLAEILVTALAREHEDRERRARFGAAEPGEPPVTQTLRRLRRQTEQLRAAHPELAYALEPLCQTIAQAQTETAELLIARAAQSDPLLGLTEREREIALLLAGELTYRELGERLGITEKTVKTHAANLIKKLDAGGRSGVRQLLLGSR
ncbi:LuxR C-terminal-related transcriptional regulator [Armatimonas rosea]|uniref:DNA-binding CsgD family transcriptional regulator n=1 Tax=Armatimonas rosea TaxID=685828 RepID=A0A7W9STT3_ARMRO|nr:DNA-binding CsgD family transcriptional regulator [Armatimonas rosea]